MLRSIGGLIAALCLAGSVSACSTLTDTDVSLAEAAVFVHAVSDVELDVGKFEDRLVLYRAAGVVSAVRRGDLTEGEALRQITAILGDRVERHASLPDPPAD